MNRTHFIGLMAALVATSTSVISLQAIASGFAIRESSTSLMGNAYAGISTSNEDISAIGFNPATLAMIEDNSIYLSGTEIFPDIKAHNLNGTQTVIVGGTPVATVPISGSNHANGIGQDAFIPAGYIAWDMSDMVKLGLAITAPWGLATSYDNDWKGRFFGVDSKLQTININPMASLSFNKHLSLAAGFQAQYIRATLTQMSPVPGSGFPPAQFKSQVKGHDWGYGYTLGALYEFTKHTRVGLGFISKIDHTLSGGAQANGAGATAPLFTGHATADITTPEKINLGFHHDINRYWALLAEIEWTHWSRFKDLTVNIDNNAGTETTSTVIENWENTWFYALGATFKPTRQWTLRGGVAYDQSPVRDEFRNPTIPDSDRVLLNVGAGYNFTDDIRVDLAYGHVFFRDASIDDSHTLPAGGANELEQTISGDYEGNANIVSIALSWVF